MTDTEILDKVRDWATENSERADLSEDYYRAVDDVLAILDSIPDAEPDEDA